MTTTLQRSTSATITGFVCIVAVLALCLPWSASAATKKVVLPVTGSFDAGTLSATSNKPTLTGIASSTKSVRLVIESSTGKSVLKKTVKVRNGEWKQRATKKLAAGTYKATLLESSKKTAKVLDTETLTIGGDSASNLPKSSGLISVDSLPLLTGGAAAQGASVPIAYLKVQNTSSAAVSLEGFTFKQNGSASGANVIGFSTSDDKGGSRTTIGGTETTKQFKNGTAYVPLAAVIAPGQVRIFTVKAIMSGNAGADLGKQLMLDVTGVKANGSIKAQYPIRGTSWVLTR